MAEAILIQPFRSAVSYRRDRVGIGRILAIGAFAGYLVTALLLVFGGNLILGDSLSRVENGARILFSHDPHLAAIGFAWGPLPTLAELPLIALRIVWPELVTVGLAANIMSAAFMAGAVHQVHRQLDDLCITGWVNVAIVVTFAANPMIVFYAANGMSEAAFIFFVLIATRQLVRWLSTGAISSQVLAGTALGAAYLCRYEGAAAGLAAIILTGIASYVRANGSRLHRSGDGICDALILAGPFLLAAISWSIASWLITGHLLDQYSSIYGTRSQVQLYAGQSHLTPSQMMNGATLALAGIVALAPPLVIVGVLGLGSAIRRRDPSVLAGLAVLASVLAANFAAYASDMIQHTIRYFIVAIPLSTLLGAFALRAVVGQHESSLSDRGNPRAGRRVWLELRTIAVPVVIVGMMAAAWPTGLAGLMNRTVSPSFEAPTIPKLANRVGIFEQDTRAQSRFLTDRQIAAHLDSLHLRSGSVLVDDFDGYAIVVSSSQPDEFVITSDRDFHVALSDPAGYGIRYLLVPEPSGRGELDAINRRYPDMYASGAGIAELVHEFVNVGDIGGNWRLYRIS